MKQEKEERWCTFMCLGLDIMEHPEEILSQKEIRTKRCRQIKEYPLQALIDVYGAKDLPGLKAMVTGGDQFPFLFAQEDGFDENSGDTSDDYIVTQEEILSNGMADCCEEEYISSDIMARMRLWIAEEI